ncbi:MAG: methionyl-tRNA formyltransferase [Legionella sp.]|nr:methionyl-tRNA formyltransferase [Legionella sp.]
MTRLNIVFAGTPEFGIPCLDALASSNHHLQAIYTQPDRPAGRGRKLQPSAVKTWALAHGLPVYQTLNFKDAKAVEELSALEPDVLVVIAYGLILPKKVLNIPKLGCINVHASLLPRARGASPIQEAILQGDSQSGVTIMQMDVGMDTGDMLAEVSCLILPDDTAGTLHDKLAKIAPAPLLTTLDALALGRAKATPQDSTLATYAGKITKENAAIDWQQSADVIDRLIRAYNPWPIAYTHAGDEVIRIHQAKILETSSHLPPGTVLAVDKNGLQVATRDRVVAIQRLQFAGGKVISITDLINSGRALSFLQQVFQ